MTYSSVYVIWCAAVLIVALGMAVGGYESQVRSTLVEGAARGLYDVTAGTLR